MPEWQRAIDAGKFLVPLVLDASQSLDEPGDRRAVLGGQACAFGFREVELSKVAGTLTPPANARFAFATPAVGEITSCAAGGAALLAYAASTSGAAYAGGDAAPFRELKLQLDDMLAVAFGKTREFEARYPPPPRSGSGATIGVARAQ